MLTRSYLIDITLVGLASFTLLCVLALTCGRDATMAAGRHAFAVEIAQPDGQTTTCRVDQTRQAADQLRDDLVQQLTRHRTPDVAWMHWFQETAEHYAAMCGEPEVARVAQDLNPESVFRTVSTGPKTTPTHGENASELGHWREFWTLRQSKATAWLARREENTQARQAALRDSIRITPVQSWLPPPSICVKAGLVAILVMLIGAVWRLACPPHSCYGIPRAGTLPTEAQGNCAAMCFRESWVRVRQPVNVVARGVVGWAIVVSSLMMLVSVVIGSLVS